MIIAPGDLPDHRHRHRRHAHLRTVGRVFAKSMAYFLFFSTLALIVGLVVAHVVQPGAGMNINPADAGPDRGRTATSRSRMS